MAKEMTLAFKGTCREFREALEIRDEDNQPEAWKERDEDQQRHESLQYEAYYERDYTN